MIKSFLDALHAMVSVVGESEIDIATRLFDEDEELYEWAQENPKKAKMLIFFFRRILYFIDQNSYDSEVEKYFGLYMDAAHHGKQVIELIEELEPLVSNEEAKDIMRRLKTQAGMLKLVGLFDKKRSVGNEGKH